MFQVRSGLGLRLGSGRIHGTGKYRTLGVQIKFFTPGVQIGPPREEERSFDSYSAAKVSFP